MSIQIMSMIFSYKMPILESGKVIEEEGKLDRKELVPASTATFVLLALADHANDRGESVYPGVQKLCNKTKLSTPTVCKALDALEKHGYISNVGYSKLKTKEYNIHVEKLKTKVALVLEKDKTKVALSDQAEETKVALVKSSFNHQLKDRNNEKEETKTRIVKGMFEGYKAHKAGKNKNQDYPPDVIETVTAFEKHFKIKPPRSKDSGYSLWIRSAREINRLSSDYKIAPAEAIRNYFLEWDREGRWHSVDSPKSILGRLRGHLGEKESGEGFVGADGKVKRF